VFVLCSEVLWDFAENNLNADVMMDRTEGGNVGGHGHDVFWV
jgi:hypothetical protein